MELEFFRKEYANVLLECNVADECAKILASEIIGLEEKVKSLWYVEFISLIFPFSCTVIQEEKIITFFCF